jgi:hypothetical protein
VTEVPLAYMAEVMEDPPPITLLPLTLEERLGMNPQVLPPYTIEFLSNPCDTYYHALSFSQSGTPQSSGLSRHRRTSMASGSMITQLV